MKTATKHAPRPENRPPAFIYHESFAEPEAEHLYGGLPLTEQGEPGGYMPDEMTRACSKRMHYAAWRLSRAASGREAGYWRQRYYEWRNRIVVGNRKLTFRAVRKGSAALEWLDDLASECQIVLIKAVAAFNPWLNIRFSTYAFTCLLRAISRLSQRHAADRLAHALPLEALPLGEPAGATDEPARPALSRLEPFFRKDDHLLTACEKSVLVRRYHLHDNGLKTATLQQVGQAMGLSKERVRQIQMSALGKLRHALVAGTPM